MKNEYGCLTSFKKKIRKTPFPVNKEQFSGKGVFRGSFFRKLVTQPSSNYYIDLFIFKLISKHKF